MQKPPMAEVVFFWILFLIAGVFAVIIFFPYIAALFLSLVLAIAFSGAHRRISIWIPNRENFTAFLSVTLVSILILAPLIFFGILLFGEAINTYNTFANPDNGLHALSFYTHQIESSIGKYVPGFSLEGDGDKYVQQALGWVAGNLNTFFSGFLRIVLNFFLIIISLFFFFRDGGKLRAMLVRWSPLADKRDEGILDRISLAISSVVKGSISIAVLQGVLTGIGFLLFGVQSPVLWGATAMIAALVPPFGAALINVPAAVYLLAMGHMVAGIGLLAWAILIVGTVDNIVRPMLLKNGLHTHPFIVLLAVLGGISFFGPIGFIVGPVLVAFFLSLAELYPSIMKGTGLPESGRAND